MTRPTAWCAGDACGGPAIGRWIVPRPGVRINAVSGSPPDNHFSTGPNRGVILPGGWRVQSACGSPTVGAGVVSSACVKSAGKAVGLSTPYDHLSTGPNCSVGVATHRRIGCARRGPSVNARLCWLEPVRQRRRCAEGEQEGNDRDADCVSSGECFHGQILLKGGIELGWMRARSEVICLEESLEWRFL